MPERYDVAVVGSGNAGLCAAIAAREAGAQVVVLEKAPEAWAGGNSAFTAGVYRMPHGGLDDVRGLVDIDDATASRIDLDPYPRDAFLDDLARITGGRSEPGLAAALGDDAAEGARWLAAHGIAWELLFHRQSHAVDGRIRFFGNVLLGSVGGGRGLVAGELAAARRAGVELRFGSAVVGLVTDGEVVTGVRVEDRDGAHTVGAGAVVLAAGGFEADPRRRTEHLGVRWDRALVRGTPHNTGEVLFAALATGADRAGDWASCHSIAWDAHAPATGDLELTNRWSRLSYPYGIMVNAEGRRFTDEGADFRNYTYARLGGQILDQPDGLAWQVFDARTSRLVSAVDYGTATASRSEADTIGGLAARAGLPVTALVATVDGFNAAIVAAGPFDPTIRDGNATRGIDPPKSHWALPVVEPPFTAFAVACGITFTFGGLRIDPCGAVLRADGTMLAGLFAAGELAGGLFWGNYPGGTGLAAGTVFGRRAGRAAAAAAATVTRRAPGRGPR